MMSITMLMMPQLIHANCDIGCCGAKSSPLVGRRKNIHPIMLNAMSHPALILFDIGSISDPPLGCF
jgi:hypothetical protein